MHPKINRVQFLDPDLRSLTVKGPIEDWEDDDFVAVFTVVVSQIDPDDGVVTAIGAGADVYRRGQSTWDAEAAVADPSTHLHEGGAVVAAWATIASPDGGAEMYAWTLPVMLKAARGEGSTTDSSP